ncbi:hypothetical protein C8R47DRAFT_1129109 [Mycena vitilis]|nr:hypothetical protein C8R47DRAFT_1129109 [Mycena vitilis]
MSLVSASTIPGYVLRCRSHAMDGVYSIVAGLVLRVVVDAATFHNVKLSGTLIGLWEGVVLLHYVNKAPSSSDPYLAYCVRLFIDFLVTESIFKLVIVLLWSTMGMVIADVAPAVWLETGMKRQWSRVRRDLYRSARILAKPRRATVRFVSTPTIASTAVADSASTVSSTVATTVFPASTAPPGSPATTATSIPPRIVMQRRSSVPGNFPGVELLSETDTDAGTADDTEDEGQTMSLFTTQSSHFTTQSSRFTPSQSSQFTTSHFPSQSSHFPSQSSYFPSQSSHVTISRIIPLERSEDSYTSRSSSPTYSLEYSDDPSATNPVDIPSDVEDIPSDVEDDVSVEEDEEMYAHPPRDPDRETTPKQMPVVLPPTPAESLQDWEGSQGGEDVPPSPWMPQIPDQEPLEEWETVHPPTPPPKDDALESLSVHEEDSDRTSIAAPSTIAPLAEIEHDGELVHVPGPAPATPPDPPAPVPATATSDPPVPDRPTIIDPPPITMPIADPAPAPVEQVSEEAETTMDTIVPEPGPAPAQDAAVQNPPPAQHPHLPATDTPPPSFRDLYGSEASTDHAAPTTHAAELPPPEEPVASRSHTPPPDPNPSPAASLRHALSLRKEALEINARIATLGRQRKASLSDASSVAAAAAMLAKIEIERAKKDLADVNQKAAGAFVGVYNPPTASLYEFNTTGLTPEEAVSQTEARLEKLLLTPVPPVGTTPEDLAHDSPNRGALKIVMEQTIKGRLVKQALLLALDENGLNWSEDTTRPNVVFVLLPVSATEEPAAAPEDGPRPKKDDDEESTHEY